MADLKLVLDLAGAVGGPGVVALAYLLWRVDRRLLRLEVLMNGSSE